MLALDPYVVDVLLPDLVGHDRRPAAFFVYLYLTAATSAEAGRATRSLQAIADGTGLSKRSVQDALRWLLRRRLIGAKQSRPTAPTVWTVNRPWRSRRAGPS